MSEDFIKRRYIADPSDAHQSAAEQDNLSRNNAAFSDGELSMHDTEKPAETAGNSSRKPVPVVVRAQNDMPVIAETLKMISQQTVPAEIYAFDNSSNDGTRDELLKYAKEIIDIPVGKYVPGKVLNHAMRIITGDIAVFLNSDCTPLDEFWLEELLRGFSEPETAAVFGRQLPREDCRPLFARDIHNTFGDGSRQSRWRHCFSITSSAIRRSVWEEEPFNEDLQYSEDIEWTWNARRRGYSIVYMQRSSVLHSHNYSWAQFYRRQYGEGRAEAQIFSWNSWETSFLRYSLLPYLQQTKSDAAYALQRRYYGTALYAPIHRLAQMAGRRRGFTKGLRERRRNTKQFAY